MSVDGYIYVVMPVRSDAARYLERRAAVERAAASNGLAVHFPMDQDSDVRDFDLGQAIEEFRGATVVVADLSMERPSCYYELGLAQAIGASVVLVAERGTEIHQASEREHVRFYRSYAELAEVLERILGKYRNSSTADGGGD
jgi:hypothetical protein